MNTPNFKLIVDAKTQTANLFENHKHLKSYKISTAKNGPGSENGSNCTPMGKLRVAQKIGDGLPKGSVLKSREPTGDIWQGEELGDDLILTRILWLEGAEEDNKNTFDRYIYLHGTNQEKDLGTPVSHGCIRFSNDDIIEIFDILQTGAEVEILYPPTCAMPKLSNPKI